jgi:excisionase family DNA binding protein
MTGVFYLALNAGGKDMSTAINAERPLNREQAAELLGLQPQTLAKWAMEGKHLAVVRVGGRSVRYNASDVQEFIERHTPPAS